MQLVSSRSPGIDMARSLAILGVVLVHTNCFSQGRYGVQLFFLISGYLLADLGKLSNRKFLTRRALRLFPLYLIVMLVFYSKEFPSFGQALISLLLVQNFAWALHSFPGAWSISNEWIYSLILPLIRNFSRFQILGIIFISWCSQVVSSYFVHSWGGVHYGTPQDYSFRIWINTLNPFINIAFFLIGLSIRRGYIVMLTNKYLAIGILTSFQLIIWYIGHDLLFLWPIILWVIFSLCLAGLPSSKFLELLFGFIGKRTYGIFFAHFIILDKIQESFLNSEILLDNKLKNFIVFVLTFLLSSIFAEISWRFIESPFIKLSRRQDGS